MEIEKFYYDNKIVKYFAYATILWGVVGMLVGLYAALQLIWPSLTFDFSMTTFGRIRPLHTNAVIFAFVGNGQGAQAVPLKRLQLAWCFGSLPGKITSMFKRSSSSCHCCASGWSVTTRLIARSSTSLYRVGAENFE